MSPFKKLQYSLAALALFAAFGVTIEKSQAGQIQRESLFARSSGGLSAALRSTPQRTGSVLASIKAKGNIAKGVSPDG